MLVKKTFAFSDAIENDRTISDIIEHAMTELGELSMENIIEKGRSYKAPGKDGIVGEAVDVMLCMLDIIRKAEPEMTEEALMEIVQPKLQKWKETQHRPG